jgi:anti-sigma-K factor RskA
MTEIRCAAVRDAAAEYALDILDPEERVVIAEHLAHCPSCQAEVDAMTGVGARLLDLVPGTEPPLGFDHRVLAQVQSLDETSSWAARAARRSRRAVRSRPRVLMAVAAVAAAVVLVFASLGWFGGQTSSHRVQILTSAPLQEGSRNVGQVIAYRTYEGPIWLAMMVHGATGAEQVGCELVETNGHTDWLGSFDLVNGSGSWGTPYPAGLSTASGANLLGSHGQVLATATFH